MARTIVRAKRHPGQVHKLRKKITRAITNEKKKIQSSIRFIILRFWQPTNVMHYSHRLHAKLQLYRRRFVQFLHQDKN